ncbi:MAG: hypothetical protein QM776_12520 [Rhodocyclaceae bacterium]
MPSLQRCSTAKPRIEWVAASAKKPQPGTSQRIQEKTTNRSEKIARPSKIQNKCILFLTINQQLDLLLRLQQPSNSPCLADARLTCFDNKSAPKMQLRRSPRTCSNATQARRPRSDSGDSTAAVARQRPPGIAKNFEEQFQCKRNSSPWPLLA